MTQRKVLPLVGLESLHAFTAFNALLLGMKMLPSYAAIPYVEFYDGFGAKDDSEKETFLREALAFVTLSREEVSALVSFCSDANGVAYGAHNVKSLGAKDLFEIVIAVCMEIGRIEITLVTETEKKKWGTSQSI